MTELKNIKVRLDNIEAKIDILINLMSNLLKNNDISKTEPTTENHSNEN